MWAGAVFAAVAFSSSVSNAAIIDFEPLTTPGTYKYQENTFVAGGFQFTAVSPNAQPNVDSATETDPKLSHPSPGALLSINGSTSQPATVSFALAGGGTFGLNSLNVNWWDNFYAPLAASWSLTGTFLGNSTQSISGIVAHDGFTPLTLNWTDLLSVTFAVNGSITENTTENFTWVGINNVDVVTAAVPEPST